MARESGKLGEILRRWGKLSEQHLKEGLMVAQGSGKRVGEVLVDLGYVSEADVARALAAQNDMEYIDLEQPDAINKDNLGLLPQDIIKKYLVLPLELTDGRLKVLIHDPMDLDTLDDLRFRLSKEIDVAIGARGKIKEYIDEMLSETKASIDQAVRDLTMDASIDRGESVDRGMTMDRGSTVDHGAASIDRGASMDIRGLTIDRSESDREKQSGSGAEEAPVIRLVSQIINEAVELRASDIHIEPFGKHVRLRYRIDGVCHEQDRIPKRIQHSVIARLKIMSGMKIEEKRVPQDGRIKQNVSGEMIDFRVSACPAYHGESVVLRILRSESAISGLSNLGMLDDTLEEFNQIIRRPNGIFLVTGPTGSGKTTTLYSALQVLNRPDRKIITAEDPVEYNFAGMNQCQVNDQIGLTFARILRAMLRQAPNVILVGEIRDLDVGDVAIQAALTGHLVFSTLHTNDAPSAITRLVDIGIKPFLVASSIQAIMAQRLIRTLCTHCREPDDDPSRRLLRLCGVTERDLEGKTIYRAVGCSQCANTGYHGRKGIYELMVMNSALRELAFNQAALSKIREVAAAGGMRNLLGDGRLKILSGLTTLAEIARITQVEGVAGSDQAEEDVTDEAVA